MSLQNRVEQKIKRMKPGKLFSYQDFAKEYSESPSALTKAIQRLIEKGALRRQEKGIFYKPQKSRFGELPPSDNEILKKLISKDGKYHGYISGQEVFRIFKMSTQVPSTKTVAIDSAQRKKSLRNFEIQFVQSKIPSFSKEDIPKLQLLDTIRFIKSAMDTRPEIVIKRVIQIVDAWDPRDIKRLVKFALKYNPRTRAIIGAILEKIGYLQLANALHETLNPSTAYLVGINANELPLSKRWNIK